MRILFVNSLFSPFSGGVEKHLLELSKALAERGVEVHVLTGRLSGTLAYENFSGVHVHRIPCTELRIPALYPPPAILAPKCYSEIEKLDAKYDFNLIHLQDRWFPDFNVAGLYARATGKPFVVTLHNARPVGIAPHYTVAGGIYDLAIGRQVLALADRVISVSEWAIGDVCKYGLDSKKFVHIPNGINTRKLRPVRSTAFRTKYSIGSGPLALFVGRVIRQKGVGELLAAWQLVSQGFPEARLAIVGRGSALAEMKRLAQKLGVQKSVIFTGYVEEHVLYEALHACDVFVLPSLWEVLPIAILEAMAAGKPVVCTSVGGNAELVENGVNGFLVPKRNHPALAAALMRVLADERLRKKMGDASRKRAEKEFDWKTIAGRTERFYKQLLKEYSRTPHPRMSLAAAQFASMSDDFRQSLRASRNAARTAFAKYAGRWKKLMLGLQQRLGSK